MRLIDGKTHASGRWLEILPALAPQLSPACKRLGRHVPCPVHGGVDGFRLFDDASETGGGICNTCGSFPDGLAVLQWANGWTFQEAVKSIAGCLGLTDGQLIPPKQTTPQPAKPTKDWDHERKRLQAIWDATVPDDGRIRRYLEDRGLAVEVPPGLRLHRSFPYFHKGPPVRYPAMVARITRDDETVGLHFTYLDPEGDGKAPCSSPRKIRKCIESISGGSIQLFPLELGKPLALAEGVETGLAIRQMTGFPVWPCVNSTMLMKVKIPDGVSEIFIGVDKDKSGAGKRAARKLAERLWKKSGRRAMISLPPNEIPDGAKSFDWADYIAQGQEVAHG